MLQPQDFVQLPGHNNDGRGRPDVDFKGLEAAIRDHAASTKDQAAAIVIHAKSVDGLKQSVDGFNSSLFLVGGICLVVGYLICTVINSPKKS